MTAFATSDSFQAAAKLTAALSSCCFRPFFLVFFYLPDRSRIPLVHSRIPVAAGCSKILEAVLLRNRNLEVVVVRSKIRAVGCSKNLWVVDCSKILKTTNREPNIQKYKFLNT